MNAPVRPLPPRPSCEAPALAEVMDGNQQQLLGAMQTIYSALGAVHTEIRATNALLKDLLASSQRREARSPMASLHDAVETFTGVHGTDSTPPALALGQKLWWKVGVFVFGAAAAIGVEHLVVGLVHFAFGATP